MMGDYVDRSLVFLAEASQSYVLVIALLEISAPADLRGLWCTAMSAA